MAYLLDGDNLRHGLSDDLGFSPGDRTENIRRVGHLTRLLADAGVVALASLVSPLASDRETARALNDAAKLPFIEVHVATSLAECGGRDPCTRGPAGANSKALPVSTHHTNRRRVPTWCSTRPAPISTNSPPGSSRCSTSAAPGAPARFSASRSLGPPRRARQYACVSDWRERVGSISVDWWATVVAGVIVALAVANALPKIPW